MCVTFRTVPSLSLALATTPSRGPHLLRDATPANPFGHWATTLKRRVTTYRHTAHGLWLSRVVVWLYTNHSYNMGGETGMAGTVGVAAAPPPCANGSTADSVVFETASLRCVARNSTTCTIRYPSRLHPPSQLHAAPHTSSVCARHTWECTRDRRRHLGAYCVAIVLLDGCRQQQQSSILNPQS